MKPCEVCGNEYDKAFELSMGGESHIFDSFECAIFAVAPKCAHCGIPIVGHGVEVDDTIFCSAHCSGASGKPGARDRV